MLDGVDELAGVGDAVAAVVARGDALGEDGGDKRGLVEVRAGIGGREERVGETRMERERGHAATVRRDAAMRIERAERAQERLGLREHRRGRRRHPAQGVGRGNAEVGEDEAQRGEVGGENFRRRGGKEMVVLRLIPEAVANARAEAAGATAALVGAVARDAERLEALHARGGRKARNAHPASVHHGVDAVDGERGLGDGGREDNLARSGGGGAKGGVLLGAWQRGVERMDRDVGGKRRTGRGEVLGAAPNFALAGEKREDAASAFGKGVADGARDGFGDMFAGRRRREAGLDGEEPPLRRHDGPRPKSEVRSPKF